MPAKSAIAWPTEDARFCGAAKFLVAMTACGRLRAQVASAATRNNVRKRPENQGCTNAQKDAQNEDGANDWLDASLQCY